MPPVGLQPLLDKPTPTVVAAVPTAQPATSKDIQGATQTGHQLLAGNNVQVNGEDKAITIKIHADNDGNEVTRPPAYAADGTTEIGTYSLIQLLVKSLSHRLINHTQV